jgi:hypothetical protein
MKKNLSYFTIVIVFLMATLLIVKVVLKKHRSGKKNNTVLTQERHRSPVNLIEMLHAEERAIWDELHEYAIEQATVQQVQKNSFAEYRALYLPDHYYPKLKGLSAQLVQEVILERGVRLPAIALIPMKGSKVPACSNDFTLYVNIELLSSLPVSIQKFIIAHELERIMHNDSSHYFALKQVLLNTPFEDKKLRHQLLSRYYHWQKKRADISVASRDEIWAEYYHEFAQDALSRTPSYSADYAFYQQRLVLAQEIVYQKNLKTRTAS